MPIALETPETRATLNVARIAHFHVRLSPPMIRFVLQKGHDDGEGTVTYSETDTQTVAYQGTDFAAIAAETCQADETIYDAIARISYQRLLDDGHLEGSIE